MPHTVARYFEPSEAHVVRALLESAGFDATVADEHHVTANYPLSTALGGVRVQVPQDQVEAAQELVAAYTRGELASELEEAAGLPTARCPACGSEDIRHRVPGTGKLFAVAVFLLGSATYPTRESLCECLACQHQWERSD